MNAEECLKPLSDCLARLPGLGRRTAGRMALRLVQESDTLLPELVRALQRAGDELCCCRQCGSVTGKREDPCRLCTSASRDNTLLCVVENPGDVAQIERSGSYSGRYHTLMGRLSPMRGQGRGDMRVGALLDRVRQGAFREVILALSTDVEGDATASFLAEKLHALNVKVSRLAFGLPAGSGVLYADSVTLQRAIQGRQLT